MSLPSSREIELETLLRQRDTQVLELTVRVFLHRAQILWPNTEDVQNRMKSLISANIYLPNRDQLPRTRYRYLRL